MKKIICIILSIVMTCVSLPAFASETAKGMIYDNGNVAETTKDNPADGVNLTVKEYAEQHPVNDNSDRNIEEAIDDLISEGVLLGFPDGDYHLDDNVTRAQLATFITRIADPNNLKHSEVIDETVNEFSDLDASHWAIREIAFAASRDVSGILPGRDDTNYGPNDSLTYLETAEAILKTLNYFELIREKGDNSDGVIYWADELGLFEKTDASENLSNTVTRKNIILMLSKALDCPIADNMDENFCTVEKIQQSPIRLRQLKGMNTIK